MKKIGFIDYFLDEPHANNYSTQIEKITHGAMKVVNAYGMIDAPGGRSNQSWCDSKGITLFSSLEEIVEQSDCLVVLSPDHPEFHEQLAELPLQSGKPVYIDKTFAPDRAAAIRMFELAEKHGTPMYSSSSLRFASEYVGVDRESVATIHSLGPGKFDNYAIHQVEPIISMMGSDVQRVMSIGTSAYPSLLIGFADGRQAAMNHCGWECPFTIVLNYESGHSSVVRPESDFSDLFVKDLIAFLETGKPSVQADETISTITILEYGLKALQDPYHWIELPRESCKESSSNRQINGIEA